MARDFFPASYKHQKRLLDLPLKGADMGKYIDDPEMAEWVVGVQWIKALPLPDAIWEQGMFANQNTACRMRSQFTIDRLTVRFNLDG